MNIIMRIFFYVSIYLGLFTISLYIINLIAYRKKLATPPVERYPTLSILVPAYNEEVCIAKTIQDLLALDYPKEKYEIIVVDDGSRDHTYKIAKQYESRQVKVFTKPNGGKGTALNFGLKKATGEFVASMDADSFVSRNALKEIMGYFDDPRVMCTAATLIVYKPKGILQRIQSIEYFMGVFLRKAFSFVESIHVTPGAFSIYRKSFFDRYGGYREDTITEDLEIALRVQAHGYKIRTSTKALVYTIAPMTFAGLLAQRRRWYTGLIRHLWEYRKLFSPKYGELGLIVLPAALISIIFMIGFTFYHLFKITSDNVDRFDSYRRIGFDFINNFSFKWFMIQEILYDYFSSPLTLFAWISVAIFLSLLFFAKKQTRQQIGVRAGFIFFLLFYAALHTVWWIVSFFHLAFKKKTIWGREMRKI